MKKIVSALICLYGSSFTYAAPCEEIINQIYSAQHVHVNKVCLVQKPKNILWHNLTWLQKKLGQADATAVVETLYQWKESTLLMRDGRVINAKYISKEFGSYPSVELISNMLGEEPQSVTSVTLHQYRWICPDSSSYLKVLVDTNKRVVSMEGQKCSYASRNSLSSCLSFASAGMATELENKMHPIIQEVKQEVRPEMLNAYNQYFKIQTQNQAQLEADMSQRLKNYFTNLRWCRTGTYAYPLPYFMGNVLLGTAVIRGRRDNVCVVETSQQIPGTNKEHHHFDMQCAYRPQDLHIFTDEEALAIATGKSRGSAAMQKARETSCKLIYNEKEMAVMQSQTKMKVD